MSNLLSHLKSHRAWLQHQIKAVDTLIVDLEAQKGELGEPEPLEPMSKPDCPDVLRVLFVDGEEHHTEECVRAVRRVGLVVRRNTVSVALAKLQAAGEIERVKRGVYRSTDRRGTRG